MGFIGLLVCLLGFMGLLVCLVMENTEKMRCSGNALLWTCDMEPVVLCACPIIGRWNGVHGNMCMRR